MSRRLFLLPFLLLAAGMNVLAQEPFTKYLFVYFPSNSDENIYYALSDNGFDYTPMNSGQRILAADSVSIKKGLRDPHILRTDDGWFLMVATDMRCAEGWDSNRGMVLLKSRDLVNWQHSTVHFPTRYSGTNFANVTRVWAPETIYDPATGKYMVYYSLLTNDGTIRYDKVYYNYANADFTDLEGQPTLLFDRGASTIDMDIVYDGTKYHAFYKNENDGGISKVTATQLTAPVGQESSQWSQPSGKLQQTNVAVEGAGVFRLIDGQTWVLMYDCYTSGYYQFCTSTDLESFTFRQNTYTSGAFTPRHGTVIPVTDAEVARIEAALNRKQVEQYARQIAEDINSARTMGIDVTEAQQLMNDENVTITELQQLHETLNLAQAEAVAASYTIDQSNLIGNWETTNWTNNRSQHYDGSSTSSYWEQKNGWGNSAWDMSMKQKLTLPAGDYVLKCAGRSASDAVMATMALSVPNTQQSVRFPTKADLGFGITTTGEASFSPNATYANNGKGRGWEWRYLPFSLSENTEITITLSASVSGAVHQWVSITSLSLLQKQHTETGIDSQTAHSTSSNSKSFDLSGRHTKPQGIYIQNGKIHISNAK